MITYVTCEKEKTMFLEAKLPIRRKCRGMLYTFFPQPIFFSLRLQLSEEPQVL